MQNTIIYSHGFGVEKTSRGMFTDISESIRGRTHLLFDYNTTTPEWLELAPFDTQARLLHAQIDTAVHQGAGHIDLVCHSQGAVAAALLDRVDALRSIILITPPRTLDAERTKKYFENRTGVEYHGDGTLAKIPRRDGTITTIPAAYWTCFRGIDLADRYEQLTSRVKTYVIFAQDDEVLGASEDTSLLTPHITSQSVLPWDHDFTGEYRKGLIDTIRAFFWDY